jgi:hypothetical protein
MGMPEWSGDTLVLIPWPSHVIEVGAPGFGGRAHRRAVQMQRERFRALAMGWVQAEPTSPEALEALALAMDLLSDPAAPDTLRAARARSRRESDQVRLGAGQAWMRDLLSCREHGGLTAARASPIRSSQRRP